MIRLETRSGRLIGTFTVETEKDAVEAAVREGISLRRLNAAKMDLQGANLRGADLRHADLREADLTRADLRDANLYGHDRRKALLTGIKCDMGINACVAFDTPIQSVREKQRARAAAQVKWARRAEARADRRAWKAHRRILDTRQQATHATPHDGHGGGPPWTFTESQCRQIGEHARAGSARLVAEMAAYHWIPTSEIPL